MKLRILTVPIALSNLGRKGYTAYWSASIARALLSARKERISIEEIVQQTWILHEDVISALTTMGLIEQKAKTSSRAILTRSALEDWIDKHKISTHPPINMTAFVDVT